MCAVAARVPIIGGECGACASAADRNRSIARIYIRYRLLENAQYSLTLQQRQNTISKAGCPLSRIAET